MNRICILLSATIVLLSPPLAWAQAPSPSAAPPTEGSTLQSRVGEPSPVLFWNRQITVFRSYYNQLSPAERATRAEEITIPNAVLVGTKTVNYSRHAEGAGSGVGTTVTIGYDSPWRQVHAMLLHAAEQTAGVRKDPAPRVWQKALSDFFVEYELVINLDHPEERLPILSELHMHIQDAFNEQGVQIMSPHFEGQPNEKVFVPKSQWFAGQGEVSAKQNGGDQSPEPPPGHPGT